ncbi:glycosyltransferase family 4 protein [Flavobacterium terrae]|uniref:Glycosyltransferase involved in cell wall bisynthesis n=1 Tax=Flavobacterium terrae TaxID=415425 RepID=A0A1M6CQJ3_9FLAO|nr:glycosyltransferase family 1 protein [Flavobacterium terrae]SHI63287.1 Glycosyltransferase involved in cell wall bisynthesis [Flavobacterium terrae]
MIKVFLESHNIKNKAGGLGTFNYELIKAIAKQDLNHLKITLNTPNPSELEQEFYNTFSYKKYTSLQRHKLFRIKTKYDVWHSLNQNTKIEPGFKPKKYILTIHDVNFVEEHSSDMDHPKNKLFIEKLNRADVITYISNFAKEQTHQYFKVPNVEEKIIYNGNPIVSDLDCSGFAPNVPIDKPFFFSLGDFIERKNFHSIVKMMKLLPDFNLIISGNNNKEYGNYIRKVIENENLINVFLTGKISDIAKTYYMKNCEAFLFPSIREGFGLPPIEAMYFGKPVFLSTKTSLPEIGGDVAFYWDNFAPEYMKETLLNKLSIYSKNKQNFDQKIRERAAFFDWNKAAQEYLNLYVI